MTVFNIAAVTGSAWSTLGSGANSAVSSLETLSSGELVAGGTFGNVSGLLTRGIAMWDSSSGWRAMDGGVGPGTGVDALLEYKGDLLVGGGFSRVGDRASAYLARWGCACYANCNRDLLLDIFDLICFQDAFFVQDPYADCNHDGMYDIADWICFQDAFFIGCP